MVRKFAWVTVPVLAAVPSWAMALALGTISVDSALNEPFSAEIPIVSVKPGDLRDVIIHLAPNSEFRRAGVERLPILSHLRFKIEKRRDGSRIVKITSRRPIKEPYLDFLVELSRPSGQLVRQYTVLLDPPEIAPAATPAAPAQRRRAPVAAPATTAQPAARPIRVPGPAPATVAKAAATAGNSYGPTRRNDTLWAIAQRLRPNRSISIHQVMIALQRANPEAFGGGNVNNLKEGYVLTLPPLSTIESLSKREAADEFQYQYEVWQARRQGRSVPRRAAPVEPPPQLRLVSPGSEKTPPKGGPGATATATPPRNTGPETMDSLRAERDFALEQAHTSEQQVRELSGRQDALQQRIAELERLIELRDADIAALQKSLGLAPTPRATDSGLEEGVDTGADMLAEGGTQDMDSAFEDEGETISGMDLEREQEGEGIPPEMLEPLESEASETVIEEEVASAESPAAGGKAPPALQPRQATPRIQAEPGLLDDPMVSAGLLALLGLLGGGAWWMHKKRRDEELEEELVQEDQEEKAIAATAGVAPVTVTQGAPVSPAAGAGSAPEAKSLLTEVDLAIAYGQYQQAEELLRRGLTLEPSRHELQEKLLEVYFKTDNRDSFENLAGQYYAAIGRDENNPGWRRVAEMGRKLFPGNPLFLLPGAGAAGAVAAAGEQELVPPAAPAEDTQAEAPAPAKGAGDQTEAGFEFDLGFLDELEGGESKADDDRTPAERQAEPPPALAGEEGEAPLSTEDLEAELRKLEMELGPEGGDAASDLSLDENKEGPPPPVAATTKEDESLELGDLDLSWMDNKEEKKTAAEPQPVKAGQGEEMQGMEFDLSGMDLPEPAAPAKEAAGEAADELGALDFGETTGTNAMDEGMDELGTKMELAQAYIDMGDPVSAREILEEVLREGDDKRKGEAEALIRKIS